MSDNFKYEDNLDPQYLSNVLKQLAMDVAAFRKDLLNFRKEQEDTNKNLLHQIERRPVDMTQMRDELYDDVSEQISWQMSKKISEFDFAINKYFRNARIIPEGRVSEQFDTEFELDKEDK